MSLLRSPYRPYTQLSCPKELDDDDRDLLRHQQQRNYETSETRQTSPANMGELRSSSDDSDHHPKGPRFASFTFICALLLFFGLLGAVAFKKLNMTTNRGNVSPEKTNLLVARLSSGSSEDEPLSPFEEAVMVETRCGKMIGGVEDGAFVFKGIPYAVPPIGQLRWSRPFPLWNHSNYCKRDHYRHATKFGSPCFQVNPYTKQYEGREDCLFLNVWTPRLDDSAGLEVMIWIHGGFLQFGSGHQPGLRPSGRLAKNLNIVFVSFNYRLHAMGFLALEQLANSGANSSFGNYGLWDQMVALEWVQANIKAFGGDPKKVTLFGPDAGGASILALLTNSDAENLFRSAWLIGPALYFNHSFDEISQHNKNGFLQRSNCSTSECLRMLPAKKIVDLFLGKDDPSFRINDQNDLPIRGIFPEQLMVVDDELITESLPFKQGDTINIPLLIGTAAQAIEFWPGPNDLRNWSWNQYKKYVTTSLDSFGPRLSQLALQVYPPQIADSNLNSSTSEMNPEKLYATMVSDVRQTCPVNFVLNNISKSWKYPIYRYILTAQPSKPVRIYDYNSLFSFHMWDVIAFFDQIETFIQHPTDEDYQFRDQIQSTVLNFVKEDQSELWLPYPKNTMILDQNTTIVDEDTEFDKRCKFWEKEGLNEYGWVS